MPRVVWLLWLLLLLLLWCTISLDIWGRSVLASGRRRSTDSGIDSGIVWSLKLGGLRTSEGGVFGGCRVHARRGLDS